MLQKGISHSRMYWEACSMWDAGPNYFAIFSAAEASAGAFCAILGNALQEQFQQFGWSWNEINMNDKLFWKYDYKERLKEWGLASSEKDNWGKMHISKGRVQKAMINSSLYPPEL